MLQVQDLKFSYPGGKEVMRGITFCLPEGRRLAVAGENGSGKTTLARLMCGLLAPTHGAVTVDGLSTGDASSIYEVRRRVGIVFQDPDDQIVETTVEREIGFGPRNLGLPLHEVGERVNEALSVFGIEHLRKRSCHLLSAGEKQIVTVASVFAMEPGYVVLDESTSLLDSRSRQEVVTAIERLLSRRGAGLAFITMRLEDVWMCDEVIFLKDGLIDFKGTKRDYFHYLKDRRFPLYGTALLMSELAGVSGNLTDAILGCDNLSSDCLAGALAAARANPKGGQACP